MLFPVSQLLQERDELVCINRARSVKDALAIMLENDYSQLPVIDDQQRLCGIVSDQSITSMYYQIIDAVSLLDLAVDHCQSPAATIAADSDVLEALERLETEYALVVVDNQRCPQGILTHYDLTRFFRDLSEGLILVEDIEVTLRQYIEAAFTTESAMQAALMRAFRPDKRDPTKPARQYDELSFGEHIQLIVTEDNWANFEFVLGPKPLFSQLMDHVGHARNQLAHFRGRLDPVQHNALSRARDWLGGRPRLHTTLNNIQAVVEVPPQPTNDEDFAGKFAGLFQFLAGQRGHQGSLGLRFGSIEQLISEPLPNAAREHRSWWSNDPSSDPHALAWLKAGWRVEDVDLAKEEVAFKYTKAALMQVFFTELLARLKQARPGITRATKVSPENWWSFGAGRSGFTLGWVFGGNDTLRVELYIDTGHKEQNKAAFDGLREHAATIEQEIDARLSWERLDNKRASRIALARPAKVTDPPQQIEEAQQWALDTMLKFADVFQPLIRDLHLP